MSPSRSGVTTSTSTSTNPTDTNTTRTLTETKTPSKPATFQMQKMSWTTHSPKITTTITWSGSFASL